jgi:predicted helicase
MTATERQFVGESEDILSMDDAAVYGDTFELLSFKEALDQAPPILSDYKIVTMVISNDSSGQTSTSDLPRESLTARLKRSFLPP